MRRSLVTIIMLMLCITCSCRAQSQDQAATEDDMDRKVGQIEKQYAAQNTILNGITESTGVSGDTTACLDTQTEGQPDQNHGDCAGTGKIKADSQKVSQEWLRALLAKEGFTGPIREQRLKITSMQGMSINMVIDEDVRVLSFFAMEELPEGIPEYEKYRFVNHFNQATPLLRCSVMKGNWICLDYQMAVPNHADKGRIINTFRLFISKYKMLQSMLRYADEHLPATGPGRTNQGSSQNEGKIKAMCIL